MRDTSALLSRNRHRYLRREQNMNDIVERLRHHNGSMFGGWLMVQAADEIERLRAEVEAWKERWEAERRDHEATIRHCDKLMKEARERENDPRSPHQNQRHRRSRKSPVVKPPASRSAHKPFHRVISPR